MGKIRSFLIILISLGLFLYGGNDISIQTKKILELGKGDIMFDSITSVCEGKNRDILVLDRRGHKVYRFDPDGKLLFSFGNRGQGPGDLAYPHDVFVNNKGEIVISEDSFYVSFFTGAGKFIKRIRIPSGLSLTYLDYELFYGWEWTPKARRQIHIDKSGKILNNYYRILKGETSISAPDETGRMVMFNYIDYDYSPSFLFTRGRKNHVIGISSEYMIYLLNNKGELLKEISRNVHRERISPKEKGVLKKRIAVKKKMPDFAKKKFINKIPSIKNYFKKVLLSDKYIFLFRIKHDISEDKGGIPVDIFKINGNFAGSSFVRNIPILISEKYFYVVKEEDDELYLETYTYKLKI